MGFGHLGLLILHADTYNLVFDRGSGGRMPAIDDKVSCLCQADDFTLLSLQSESIATTLCQERS